MDYVIIHRKGSENGKADIISKKPDLKEFKVRIQKIIFDKILKEHLRQRRITIIKIFTISIYQEISQYNDNLPKEQKKNKIQVLEKH